MAVKSWKDEGDRLYKASDFQGAVEKYTKAIKSTNEQEDPDIYVCYSNRCACYLQLLDYQNALSDANACIRLKPQWPKGYNRKGSCLVHLKRLDEAYEVYERALDLDSNNTEAINALAKLRTSSSNSSSNTSNTNTNNNNTPSFFSTIQTKASEFIQQISTMDSSAIFASISAFFSLVYFQASNYWNSLHPDTRKYITIGGGLLLVYYFFFYQGSSQNYYPDSYSQYSGSYGQSGYGGGGLSWTMWAAIMGAAYKLPPMFPDQLGEYARPFFGMSWTTFMWLLNMVTNNRGGGMGRGFGGGYGGGGFGGRRGGMFGRRY